LIHTCNSFVEGCQPRYPSSGIAGMRKRLDPCLDPRWVHRSQRSYIQSSTNSLFSVRAVLEDEQPPLQEPVPHKKSKPNHAPRSEFCFPLFFFLLPPCLLSNHSRLKAGSFVAKRWKADGKTYFGVVDEVSYGDNNALQSVSISYVDGDHEDHHCDDSSFDSNDFRIVPASVPQGGAGDLVHMVDLAGAHIRSTLVKQMEARLWDKLHSFITQRSTNVRLGSWCRVTLKWSRDEHRLYFASIEPRQLQTDAEMIAILFPYKGALPWKRIGHRKQEPNQLQRIVVCAKGFVKHTKDHTTVKFAYARFDLIDGVWVNRWVQPDGAPWDKKD
jgi:hypothetical protein